MSSYTFSCTLPQSIHTISWPVNSFPGGPMVALFRCLLCSNIETISYYVVSPSPAEIRHVGMEQCIVATILFQALCCIVLFYILSHVLNSTTESWRPMFMSWGCIEIHRTSRCPTPSLTTWDRGVPQSRSNQVLSLALEYQTSIIKLKAPSAYQ